MKNTTALERKISRIRSVAVYCSSRLPTDPVYADAAAGLGRFLAAHAITLVYGGSNSGLMKILADSVLENGGAVTGVFTSGLSGELRHTGLTECLVSATLAERKAEMLRRADAAIALPGGFGTWDELFDALALRKIRSGGHKLPVGIFNVNGFFDPLLRLIARSIDEGFVSARHRELLKVGSTPEELFRQLAGSVTPDKCVAPAEVRK